MIDYTTSKIKFCFCKKCSECFGNKFPMSIKEMDQVEQEARNKNRRLIATGILLAVPIVGFYGRENAYAFARFINEYMTQTELPDLSDFEEKEENASNTYYG